MSHSLAKSFSQQKQLQENNWFQKGLIKIAFTDTTIISANATTVIAVPEDLHQQIMSTIRLVHCYTQFGKANNPQPMGKNEYVPPIKLGEPFYLEFFFLNKYLYFNEKEGKFMLSSSQKTVFKIMSHVKEGTYDSSRPLFYYANIIYNPFANNCIQQSKTSKRQQKLGSIGKIKLEVSNYHIIMAEQSICLKSNGSSIYAGNYDEKAQLRIFPALFSNNISSIYHSPCLLYSLQEEKYVLFDFKTSQMKLSSSKNFIQGLCRLQQEKEGISVRIMQLNSHHYLYTKQQNELNEEMVSDLSKMLKNISLRQFSMDSFARRQYSASAQKLSFGSISGVASYFPTSLAQEVREDFIANISIKHFNKRRAQNKIDKDFVFKIESYRNGEANYNICFSKQSQKIYQSSKQEKKTHVKIQYSLEVALPSKTFILRENNQSSSFMQKNKLKNLFRVQIVRKQHFAPFVGFYSLYMNISLFKHYKKMGKAQINISEIQCILQEMLIKFQMIQEHDVNELECILLQLADLDFLTILYETILAVVDKSLVMFRQDDNLWVEQANRGQEETINLVIKLIVLLIRIIPVKTAIVLLHQKALSLLEKLSLIDAIYRHLIKINNIPTEQPEKLIKIIDHKIESSNRQTDSRAHKLCSLWGMVILKKYNLKSLIIQNACFSLVKIKYHIINYDTLLTIELMQLINSQNSFVKQILPSLTLQQLKNQEIQMQVRLNYLQLILNGYRSEIRLPLIMREQKQLGQILQHYRLTRQNKAILTTYIQEILPENNQVELVENKIISFGLVQLFLQLQQEIFEFEPDLGQNKIKILGFLINHLQNNITVYKYQLELQSKYLLVVLNTLYRAYSQYLKQLFYNQFSQTSHNAQKKLLQNCLSKWQLFIQSKSIETQKTGVKSNQSLNSPAVKNKVSRRLRFKNKIKHIKHRIVGTISKISNLFFQNTNTYLVNGIDREYIWSIIDGKFDYVNLKERVSIFQQIIELVNLQINPSTLLKQLIKDTKNDGQAFSEKFVQILLMFVDKTYQHNFLKLIDLLNSSLTQNDEWKIIIALFNKNRLLASFLSVSINKEKQPRKVDSLYTFLLNLLKKHLQFSRFQDQRDIKTSIIQKNYFYLQLKDLQITHQCQPANFLKHLKQIKPSYQKSEVQLHFRLICSLGVIIDEQYYQFYQQYIIRFQCQNYSQQLIQLILAFFQTLPKIYKQSLANALSYSYFKQHQQLKTLILKLSELTQVSAQQEDKGLSTKRPSNFKFLLALDDQQQIMRKKSWGEDDSDLLSLLFELFSQITNYSTNAKDFASKISYSIFYNILDTLKDNLQLKASMSRFLSCHVRKSFAYMKENYMQEQKDNKRLLQQNQQWKYLIEWIKGTNNFLYSQIQFFKKLSCSNDELKCYINYIVILIQKIQLREEITDHFMPNRSEKIKNYINSSQADQASFHYNLQAKDLHLNMLAQDKESFDFGKSEINQSYFSSISQINQMLSYQLIQKLEQVLTDQQLTAEIGDLLFWLENKYGISLNKITSPFFQNKSSTNLLLNLINEHETKDSSKPQAQVQDTEGHYQKINDFLRPRIENYLVLLIQLLQRNMLLFYHTKTNSNLNQNIKQQDYFRYKVSNVLNLIELCLQDQIIINQQLDKANQKRLYQTLPFKLAQISDFEKRRSQQKLLEKQNQKYCKLEYSHIEVIFKLLIKSFTSKQHEFVSHLHLILQKTSLYNIQNQISLQQIIKKNYSTYFQIVYSKIKHFKCTSPLVSYQNFVFYDLFYHQKFHFYGNSLIMSPPSTRSLFLKKYEDKIRETRGIVYYRNEWKYFKNTINMFIAVSKYLNFSFKQLLSHSTIDKQSLLYQLLELLQQTVVHNMSVITFDKLQLIQRVVKLIVSFLRGPIEPNIHICIEKLYYANVLKHLLRLSFDQKKNEQGEVKRCLLRIKKIVAQTIFIINPYMPQGQIQIHLIEQGFRNSYFQSRKLYQGNYEDIIIDYNDPQKRLEESLLFFDLALHFFYCLIQLYSFTGNVTIQKTQLALLKRYEKKKKHEMRWKSLYQIYRLAGDIVSEIKKKLSSTYQDLTLQDNDDAQLLKRAIQFFSQHVGNVDVKIQGKIKTIAFLLLKQTKCRTRSIRNELHRWVGTDERALRLNNFLAVSKFIILRLQIQAAVTKVIQNFKPLQVIIKNRELWKSLCFWIVITLNLIYVFSNYFNQYWSDDQILLLTKFLLSIIYLIQIFLVIIYVVEIIPLKVKIYQLLNQDSFKISSIFTFLRVKTLYFIIFYLIFVSLSFVNLAWISVLTIDYFYRFKNSDSIIHLLYSCLIKIFFLILLTVFIVFATAVIQISTGVRVNGCNTPAACAQQNFSILFGLIKNISFNVQQLSASSLIAQFFGFIIKILLKSLLVGLIFAEKNSQIHRYEQTYKKIKHSCFICGFSQNEIEKVMKKKDGFYMHLRIEHNLWNYINYLIYLKNRDKKDLNSIQSLIVQKWNNNEISWLPDQIGK